MARKIRVFDSFTLALKEMELNDSALYSWNKNRLALSHVLANHLEKVFKAYDQNIFADFCPYIVHSRKALNPDILVSNRNGKNILSIVCRNDYLSEEEQKELLDFQKSTKCELVMAVSFFPQKNYMLLYRATSSGIEYYHFDRNTLTTEAVRTKNTEKKTISKDQLRLI